MTGGQGRIGRWGTVTAAGATALALLAAAAGPGQAEPREPASRPADKWAEHYRARVETFRRENAAARNVVLVGSSHVEGFDAARLLPGRRVVNRGIAADGIGIGPRGVLHRLDSSVFDCHPGVVVLESGVNDLGELQRHGRPGLEEIEACYRTVVRQVRQRLPEVPLIIVAVFPTRDRHAVLNPLVAEFNRRLAAMADAHGCRYLDMHAVLVGADGLLHPEYSRDGLHLSEAGYRLWAGRIAAELDALGEAAGRAQP